MTDEEESNMRGEILHQGSRKISQGNERRMGKNEVKNPRTFGNERKE
jgi:hypothetical protein